MTLLVHQEFGPPDAMHYEKFYCSSVLSSMLRQDSETKTSAERTMPRMARIQRVLSLRSSLVNLPVSIYEPLLARSMVPACFERVRSTQLDVHHRLCTYSVHKVLQCT